MSTDKSLRAWLEALRVLRIIIIIAGLKALKKMRKTMNNWVNATKDISLKYVSLQWECLKIGLDNNSQVCYPKIIIFPQDSSLKRKMKRLALSGNAKKRLTEDYWRCLWRLYVFLFESKFLKVIFLSSISKQKYSFVSSFCSVIIKIAMNYVTCIFIFKLCLKLLHLFLIITLISSYQKILLFSFSVKREVGGMLACLNPFSCCFWWAKLLFAISSLVVKGFQRERERTGDAVYQLSGRRIAVEN